MKFLSVLVLAAAGTAVAKGGKNSTTKAVSTKAQCRQMFQLESLQALAANDTLLATKTKNNETKIAEIKAKASEAATKLTTLQSNATLVSVCGQIAAVEQTTNDCRVMQTLEHLQTLAANQTALDLRTKGNTTKADAIKAKAADAQARLTSLQSNSTLTAYCSVLSTKETCKVMSSLAKQIAKETKLANNATALDSHFEGNATMIEKFKAKLSKQSEKLTTMQSNATLASFCGTTNDATTGTTGTTAAGVQGSGAASAQVVSVSASLLAVIAAGAMLL